MTVLVAALAALLGATLQSATGFGFALVSAPLLVAVLGPRTAVSTMMVLALVVTVLTLAGERRRPRVEAREAIALVAWALPGLLAGAVVLRVVPERALQVMVAVVVLAALVLRLRAPPRARPWSHGRAAATGLTSGVLSTSTGIGGPPLVFHILARSLSPERMRDTLAVVWLGGGALGIATMVLTGSFALPGEMPLLLVAAVAGQLAGRRIFAALYGDRYEPVVLAVLAATALVALVAAAT